jgi:7-cyano-7-deazaguanine synthase in queuosine biosynthesis
MANLILFSGGIDSAAIVAHLASADDTLLYVHSPRGANPQFSNPAVHAAKAFGRPLFEMQADEAFGGEHQIHWLLEAADRQLRVKNYTNVWYGLFSGELSGNQKVASYAKAVSWFAGRNPSVSVSWPLYHLTKAQCVKLIPPHVFAHLSSCRYAANCQQCFKCMELNAAVKLLQEDEIETGKSI